MNCWIFGFVIYFFAFAAMAASQTNTFPSSGNVGIGTTNPTAPLHIVSSSGDPIIEVQTTGIGNPGIVWANSAGFYNNQIDSANGSLYWWSGGARSMTLQQNGYLGIGTTSPSSILTIGNGYATGGNQVFNNLELQLAGVTGTYYGMGTGILFDTTANGPGATNAPVGQIMGYLVDGGSSGTNYAGNLGFAAKGESNSAPVERMTIQGSTGNVGIGTTNPGAALEVNGNVKLSTNSGASITFQDGTTQSTAYTGVTCGGDYAESVDVTGDRTKYEPGDVLVIDPKAPGKFLKSIEPYSTSVTGIYSTKPGTIGRRQLTSRSPDEVPMAMMGIVPTKVSAENGAIQPGDLLVTASKVGYAMKGTDRNKMLGAVIGKALGGLESGTGTIEVVVTLQ